MATALREQVRAIDPDLPLFDVMTLDDLLAASDERVGLRVFGTMFAVFACVALLLATVGLYAVTAYAAAQRTREIGVRVALGAQAKQIWWLVTRSAAWQLGIGLSIGMVGAIGIGQLLGSVLIGTSAMDPVTLFARRRVARGGRSLRVSSPRTSRDASRSGCTVAERIKGST